MECRNFVFTSLFFFSIKLLAAQAGDEPVTFVYNETDAITNLEKTSQLAAIDPPPPKAILPANISPEIIRIAWMLVAVGENSSGSPEMKVALDHLKTKFGSQQIPYYIRFVDERGALFKKFFDEVPNPPKSFGTKGAYFILGNSRSLFSLIVQVENRIKKRSGFDFGNYEGPVPMENDNDFRPN